MSIEDSVEYKSIVEFYGTECAKRSQVPKMNHIDEGLIILRYFCADDATKKAWCLHPIIQMDEDLIQNYQTLCTNAGIASETLMLAMEYRNKANAYLCRPHTDGWTVDDLPSLPLQQIRFMLIADKVQNYKDFMIHHHGTHDRSKQLYLYFQTWFQHLQLLASDVHELLDILSTISKSEE